MSRAILQEPRGTATPYLEQVFQIHNNALRYLENPGEMFFSSLITVSAYVTSGDKSEEKIFAS
jgi:hypothetical protein